MAMWFARSRNLVSSLRQNLGLSAILIKRNHSSPRPVLQTISYLRRCFGSLHELPSRVDGSGVTA
ncbi:hypothetical protein Bca52824_063518 [Brassica carinata]|uniref:Uncharacterized protein n=1 Tax=Brassica carinata TaxID=52824 RepID=A0A8X7QG93_BRACI|nr:hypothetical protein Bca52824_063518 [Brassica carinata]